MALDFYIQDGKCQILCADPNAMQIIANRKEAMAVLVNLQQSTAVGYALEYKIESAVITLDAKYASKLIEEGLRLVEAPEQSFAAQVAQSLKHAPAEYKPSKLHHVVTKNLGRH